MKTNDSWGDRERLLGGAIIALLIAIIAAVILFGSVEAAPAAACGRVRVTGILSQVRCNKIGRCAASMYGGPGKYYSVRGWGLVEGQAYTMSTWGCW